MPEPLASAALFFADGKSDKEYRLTVEKNGAGYVVNYAYGRRGAKLRTGTKTPIPVGLLDAKIEFNRVVAEKTGEGYKPDKDGPPLDALMQTGAGRRLGFSTARVLQEELWARNYLHSWGKAEEWATLLSEHPEVLELPPTEAGDRVLAHLSDWSPTLAAKELKARGLTEEQKRESAALRERLLRARINEIPFGPAEAGVSMCQFSDDHLAPPFKPGAWGVLVKGQLRFVDPSEDAARQHAQKSVELGLMKVKTNITFGEGNTLTVTARLIGAPMTPAPGPMEIARVPQPPAPEDHL